MNFLLSSLFTLPSSLLLLLSHLSASSAQFIYPPNVPSSKTLADYTSGASAPITSYVIHDAIIGSYSTPKSAFTITRCARAGSTTPIYPSNSTFNSTMGHIAADGTWQVMDSYSNGMFPNVYSAGNNLWIIADFADYVGNDTTGHMCWWELYSVSEKQVNYGTWSDNNTYTQDLRREVTLLGGDTDNYFASTPFVVDTTMRLGNRNYTWRSSGGSDNSASSTTISVGNRPTGNAAPRAKGDVLKDNRGMFEVFSFVGVILGLGV